MNVVFYSLYHNSALFYAVQFYLFRYSITSQNPVGRYWGRVSAKEPFVSVDYGANDEVLAVSKEGVVYSRVGMQPNTVGNSWKQIASNFKSITASFYGYWLLDRTNSIFFSPYVPSKTVFPRLTVNRVNGKFRKVTAGFGGNVWALDMDYNLFQRLNVHTLSPSGTGWKQVLGLKLYDISAGYDAVYGVMSSGRIVKLTGKIRIVLYLMLSDCARLVVIY